MRLIWLLLLGMAPALPPADDTATEDTGMTTTAYPASAPPHYGTDPGVRATLTTDRQDSGRADGEPLPAGELNATVGAALDWCGYLSSLAIAAGQWGVTDLAIYDTIGGTLMGVLDQSAGTLRLAATNAMTIGSAAGNITITPTGGDLHLTTAQADTTGGWGYQSATDIVHDYGPARGGYMTVETDGAQGEVDAQGGWSYDTAGGVQTYRIRRPLDIPDSGRGTWSLQLAAGDAKARLSNSASSITIRLVSLATTGTGGAETTTTLWSFGGTTYDYDANLVPSTSSVSLTPGNRYAIEVELDYTDAAHNLGVQALDLTVRKTVVE